MTIDQEKLILAKSKLANLTELVLPTDYPRPVPLRIVDSEQILDLDEQTSLAVLKLSMQQTSSGELVSPFTILLSAFSVLLHKYTGEEDISIGSSGLNCNTLVLRLAVKDSDSFLDTLVQSHQVEKEAVEDDIPFDLLLEEIAKDHTDNTSPSLFRVRFLNMVDTDSLILQSVGGANCDLTIFISQKSTLRRLLPIQIRVMYNAVLFSEKRVQDMLDQFQLILSMAAENPQCRIGEFSLVTGKSSLLLPDCTSCLNWDQFEGAITDIFMTNSLKFPNRTCVVESSDTDVPRQFTYQQINEASNKVAHFLVSNGIQREEVIVLYSYRSVDLVVAIMGVLKAGATFCVVDPAYPPARQIVYLSVAKPKGLVILAKTLALDDQVREYINKELEIKCEIPSLELLDNGNLKGGVPGDGCDDILERVSCENTQIVLGPDSIGTLSFTSGSTGIPKGVRGRHFSLTHFYPWMKTEFEMSENDRFTMLSGIAHDPIQRDIFTPLFLGAQLRIPTAEDIGIPGRLAEWMHANEITVTHLTPAMGQLLSANALQEISTLKNVFFVGDVLTKRDVKRLQNLAPNTFVINMYGTTETQRAVSYLKIPPPTLDPAYLSEQKDIMPAGKGMIDVQLLILNKRSKLCGVGELGEIYVRSSGLAEGYLGLKEATEEKFVTNPFTKPSLDKTVLPYYLGQRDRMYKSGDLGRYRSDGSVECTGRADDQVKIRGFRIELKEIDTHISQYDQVRENVTLVRRDKDEEKVLVSYIVPLQTPHDMNNFTGKLREWLKVKLPTYAIPGVFVPLARMPLTPNGKIDKNALPFPDTALQMSSINVNKHLTLVQQQMRDVWATILKVHANSILLEDNFFDKGGHSILATRLIFEIRKLFANDTPLSLVFDFPTLKGMCERIERLRGLDLNLARQSTNDKRTIGDSLITESEKISRLEDGLEVGFDCAAQVDDLYTEHLAQLNSCQFNYPETKNEFRVFITGVTGFLGAFIVSSLLKRFKKCVAVCHVRAKTESDAFERVKNNLKAHLQWNEENGQRIQVVCGDLAQPKLGLQDQEWENLSRSIDFIIHNGALVHWVYPYSKLKAANVLSTIECLKLCSLVKGKSLHFVSSTSVLDTFSYTQLLESTDQRKVMEADDLEKSSKGLRSGYGQSKWVSEKIIMKARYHGFKATIIRPGYIVGDSVLGVGNVDDFLWRLAKGCVQLKLVPNMSNFINMCPVDYVAGVVVAVLGHEENLENSVHHVWNPHNFKFDDLFGSLKHCGYQVTPVDYVHWRTALMQLTMSSNDHALYPLLHFVLDDLPTSTKAPELDDTNTVHACKKQVELHGKNGLLLSCPDLKALMPLYLGFFAHIGFMENPAVDVEHCGLETRAQWTTLGTSQSIGRSGR